MNNNTPKVKIKPAKQSKLKYIVFIVLIIALALAIKESTFVKKYLASYNNPVIATTSSVNRLSGGIEELLAKIESYEYNLQTEQSKIDTLYKVVEDSIKKLQNQDSKTVIQIISLYKLLESLKGNQDFSAQLDALSALSLSPTINALLQQLKPYQANTFLAPHQLLSTYQNVHQKAYLIYLNQQQTTLSKIKYFAYNLFFVTNSKFTKYKPNDIRYTLNYVRFLLEQGNLAQAYDEFNRIALQHNIQDPSIDNWLQHLEVRIFFEETSIAIQNEINNIYIK